MTGKIMDFDYWVKGIYDEASRDGGGARFHAPDRLHFSIIDERGVVVGSEDVSLKLQVRHYQATESL